MLSDAFDSALVLAHELHRRQKRKVSNVPYISHLLAVASLVIEDGGSEDEAIAALFHDSIEDQSHRYPGGREQMRQDLERKFGPEVVRIVEACTENYLEQAARGGDRRARWRTLKEAYLRRLRSADLSVRRVSCADSLHNVRALIEDHRRMGEKIWLRFRAKSREDQLWLYDALAHVFLETGTGRLAEELNRAVDELCREAGVSRPALAR